MKLPTAIILIALATALSAQGGTISGTVVHADTEKPVANVTVQLLVEADKRLSPVGGLNPTHVAKTDKHGRFKLADVPDGEWYVGVRDDQMAPASNDTAVSIGKKMTVRGLKLKVTEGASLEGGVYLDEDFEKGVPNLVIEYRGGNTEDHAAWAFRTATDANGKFRLGGLPVSEWGDCYLNVAGGQPYVKCSMVFVDDEAFFQDMIMLKPAAHLTRVEFQVKPAFTVSGVVLGLDGKPAAGSEIGHCTGMAYEPDSFDVITRAGEDGRFTIVSQEYPEGFVSARNAKLLSNATPYKQGEECTLGLVKPSRIRGQVVDKNGRPMEKASLDLDYSFPNGSSTWRDVELDKDARFDSGDLFAGQYKFIVSDFNKVYGIDYVPCGMIELGDGETVEDYKVVVETVAVEDVQKAGLPISGTVKDAGGKPIADAVVECFQRMNQRICDTRTGQDGAFTLPTPYNETNPPDGLTLVISATKFDRAFLHDVKPGTTDNNALLQPAPVVNVTVLEDGSGKPVTKFHCRVDDDNAGIRAGLFLKDLSERDLTSEEGRFAVALPASLWDVTISAEGFLPEQKRIELKKGQPPMEVQFRLKKPAVLKGIVRRPDGKPLEGAEVHVYATPTVGDLPSLDALRAGSNTKSDARGKFTLSYVYPGPITVVIKHPAYARLQQELSIKGGRAASLKFRMPQFAIITGRVTEGGKPVADAEVSGQQIGAMTAADGTYKIEQAQSGEIPLYVAIHPGNLAEVRYFQRKINTEPGQTATVNFDFVPGTSGLRGTVTLDGAPARTLISIRYVHPSGDVERILRNSLNDGSYSIAGLPPGKALLRFINDKRTAFYAVEFPENAPLNLDAQIVPGVTVSGTLKTPVDPQRIFVRLLPGLVTPEDLDQEPVESLDTRVISGCRIADNNTFSMANIPPGKYTLMLMDVRGGGQEITGKYVLAAKPIEVASEPISGIELDPAQLTPQHSPK